MARTYLSQLVTIVHQLCVYITRYQAVITPLLDTPEKEIFIALAAACSAFMQSDIVEKAKFD